MVLLLAKSFVLSFLVIAVPMLFICAPVIFLLVGKLLRFGVVTYIFPTVFSMVTSKGLTYVTSHCSRFIDKLFVVLMRFSVQNLWSMVVVLNIHDRIDIGVIAFDGVKVHTFEFEVFPIR